MAAHKGAISLPEQVASAFSSLWQMLADWDTKGAIFFKCVCMFADDKNGHNLAFLAVGKRRHTPH